MSLSRRAFKASSFLLFDLVPPPPQRCLIEIYSPDIAYNQAWYWFPSLAASLKHCRYNAVYAFPICSERIAHTAEKKSISLQRIISSWPEHGCPQKAWGQALTNSSSKTAIWPAKFTLASRSIIGKLWRTAKTVWQANNALLVLKE